MHQCGSASHRPSDSVAGMGAPIRIVCGPRWTWSVYMSPQVTRLSLTQSLKQTPRIIKQYSICISIPATRKRTSGPEKREEIAIFAGNGYDTPQFFAPSSVASLLECMCPGCTAGLMVSIVRCYQGKPAISERLNASDVAAKIKVWRIITVRYNTTIQLQTPARCALPPTSGTAS